MLPLRVTLPDGRPLAPLARQTEHMHERSQGWLGRGGVAAGEGLLLVPCSAVHSVGMAFAIDVVFLDRQGRVLKLRPGLRPGGLAWGPWTGLLLPWTVMALELPAGTLAAADLRVGQRLGLETGTPPETRP